MTGGSMQIREVSPMSVFVARFLRAAETGQEDYVRRSIYSLDVPPGAANEAGVNALMMTAKHLTSTSIAEFLIYQGVDVNAVSKRGMTALMYAAMYGNVSLCRRLLAASRQTINHKDVDGQTALMKAASQNHADICADLIAANANPNMQDLRGDTALMISIRLGAHAAAQTILSIGRRLDLLVLNKYDKSVADIAMEFEPTHPGGSQIIRDAINALVDHE